MTSNERTEKAARDQQPASTWPFPGCCGVDFATLGAGGSGWRSPAAGAAERGDDDADSPPACPMATMCRRMLKARRFGSFMLILAVALLALGVAIALSPKVLSWLVAGALLCVGGLILVTAYHSRRPGQRAA